MQITAPLLFSLGILTALIAPITIRIFFNGEILIRVGYLFFQKSIPARNKRKNTSERPFSVKLLLKATRKILPHARVTVNKLDLPYSEADPFRRALGLSLIYTSVNAILLSLCASAGAFRIRDTAYVYEKGLFPTAPLFDISVEARLYKFFPVFISFLREIIKRRIKKGELG